ncbi:hypothetical protein PG997_011476 [Apiospora hydei]|uniref:peptidylprolyl isomerase n=1 Tax=Apiospora hydei TaxID=1337664 RepID=A0ABR1VJ82_9PEZI
MDITLEESGLGDVAVDGIIDIYCVNRQTTGEDIARISRSNVFRARPHWEPEVAQSRRGMSIFLSSLWVLTSLVQNTKDGERFQDAVFHVFDQLTKFPPALRTLFILIQRINPTAVEIAALSQAMYEVLDDFVVDFIHLLDFDHRRVFEGARLWFGYVLDKAKALPPLSGDSTVLPWIQSLKVHTLQDHKTGEGLLKPIRTSQGLMEATLFEYLQGAGLLADSDQRIDMVSTAVNPEILCVALLSGGMGSITAVLSRPRKVGFDVEDGELGDLDHLSELCARNKLDAHMPSQLASSIAPCLTFDWEANLAVYIGKQGHGTPVGSPTLFRPFHVEDTTEVATDERLTAHFLKGFQDDGTAAFDQYGGTTVKRMLAPDELLMFCVDLSASMGQDIDFTGANDLEERPRKPDIEAFIDPVMYHQGSLGAGKETLCDYEGFGDMIAIVAQASPAQYRDVAAKVLDMMRIMLSTEICRQSEEELSHKEESRLHSLKVMWSFLKTDEESILNLLIYHAATTSEETSQQWTWLPGDEMPANSMCCRFPKVTSHAAHLPSHLQYPLSKTLLLDSVTAADGNTYSCAAIKKWFSIQTSSPKTGEPLQNTKVQPDKEKRTAARHWKTGDDLACLGNHNALPRPTKRPKIQKLRVVFDSLDKSFQRDILPSTALEDLYALAFPGLEGQVPAFQLSTDKHEPLATNSKATMRAVGIGSGNHIRVQTAGDYAPSDVPPGSSPPIKERVLVKVYDHTHSMLFSYWVYRDTDQTISSVIWKYWRYCLQERRDVDIEEMEIRTDIKQIADGLLTWTTQKRHKRLSTLFNRHCCHGHLGRESALVEEGAVHSDHQPLVLKLSAVRPERATKNKSRSQLSRLDFLKQMTEKTINRILAYDYKPHVGLVTFATKPTLAMDISYAFENAQLSIDNMQAGGDTALWDALALGADQLNDYGKKFPHLKKRIICISDGLDTSSSTTTSAAVLNDIQRAGIVVDSISLGGGDKNYLMNMSHRLGGYLFQPKTLLQALTICELEPFLSLTERPTAQIPKQLTITQADEDIFPPRKKHPNSDGSFICVTTFAETHATDRAGRPGTRPSKLRTARLLQEIRALAQSAAPCMPDVYISAADLGIWKIVLSAPASKDTPYAAGTFLLHLHAEEGRYPTFAPRVWFATPIRHPSVSEHGRVCLPVLDRDWTTDTSMPTLFDAIRNLFFQTEHVDTINTTATLSMHRDEAAFENEVREHVRKYATKSKKEWRAELLGSS